ncbi:MAG: hypothetical protein JNJ43_17985 [Anaerolineales bacterium]|nr:hypothetical protein [Anaerolineales bacterium]
MNKKLTQKNNMENKNLSKTWRFLLLPIVNLLYTYGIISVTTICTIFVVYIFSDEPNLFQGITFEMLLLIVIGTIIFFPIRKYRKNIREDS